MSDKRLPSDEIEVACLGCGTPVIRPKKRRGRHSRYCSEECKRVAQRRQGRAWRERHPERVAEDNEARRRAYWTMKLKAAAEEGAGQKSGALGCGTGGVDTFLRARVSGSFFSEDETMNVKPEGLPTNAKELADLVLGDALALMRQLRVPLDVQLDRLTVTAAGGHVKLAGSNVAASCFRAYADRIEGGLFDKAEARH